VVDPTCSVDGCEAPLLARGLCNRCYVRLRYQGFESRGTCSIEGCDRALYARALCNSCYVRLRYQGKLPTIHRSPEERFWDQVTKTDSCWLWTGTIGAHGYGRFYIGKTGMQAHRYAYELVVGPPLPVELDHRATCPKKCVNPVHLRPVTRKQNSENLVGANRNSKTGIRGVSRDSARNLWRAAVVHNKRQYHVGRFASIAEAEAAAIAKRNELFTHNDVDRGLT
jgi:hypothetical protein